jgi:hypothetical protein
MGLFDWNKTDDEDAGSILPPDTSLWDFHGWEPIDFSKTNDEDEE